MKKKRLTAAIMMVAMLLGSCGADANKGGEDYKPESGGIAMKAESLGKGGGKDMAAADSGADGSMGGHGYEGENAGIEATGDSMLFLDAALESKEGIMPEPMEGGWDMEDIPIGPTETFEPIEPAAGLLTAGEWCDNQNWGFMSNLVSTGRFDFQVYGIRPYERVVLHVLSDGEAVRNVKAELMDEGGDKIAEAVTDYAGTAYLYYNVYADEAKKPAYVLVSVNNTVVQAEIPQDMAEGREVPKSQNTQGNSQEQQAAVSLKSQELTIEIPDNTPSAKRLDVMFVFDTTGSMGDELLYLQKEFEDIAVRVADQSTRFSVNFYRDFEDEYIVRSNEFTSDIEKVATLLNAEYADGGGDYEEAVDLALVDAVLEHNWNADSTKLMFLILDAPPHNTAEVAANLKKAVSAASAMGIRIIPIASSGVDTATEALLRDMAMLTGGTYTFLTNDSGIGGEHLEPTIGSYTVEALNDLIVHLIFRYYQ